MADKLLIHKIIPSVDQNKWLKRLNTQLNEPTDQNSLQSPKLLGQRIRKHQYKTLETSVIKSPKSPTFLSAAAHRAIIERKGK